MNKLSLIKKYKSKIISLSNGNVLKMINKNSNFYREFGELYFSEIKYKKIKAWKRHKRMNMILTVPFGLVKFIFYEETKDKFKQIIIGSEKDKYKVLSVPPNIWFGFQGFAKPISIVCNLSNIVHDPKESDNCDINDINYEW